MEVTLPRRPALGRIQQAYDRLAPVYPIWAALTESKAIDRVAREVQDAGSDRILDVGVGTGAVLERAAGPDEETARFGLDLSPGMLARSRRRLSGAQRVGLVRGTADRLPFPDDRFDAVASAYLFDLLPEERFVPVLEECERVLSPGGVLAVAVMGQPERWFQQPWAWIAEHAPGLLAQCRPVDVRPAIEETGFREIRVEHLSQATFPSQVVAARSPRDPL